MCHEANRQFQRNLDEIKINKLLKKQDNLRSGGKNGPRNGLNSKISDPIGDAVNIRLAFNELRNAIALSDIMKMKKTQWDSNTRPDHGGC